VRLLLTWVKFEPCGAASQATIIDPHIDGYLYFGFIRDDNQFSEIALAGGGWWYSV